MEIRKEAIAINSDSGNTLDNFIGVTGEKNGFYNFAISKADFSLFDSQEFVSNSLFEFFLLELINNPKNKIYTKKDFLIISFEFFRNFESEGTEALKSFIMVIILIK